MSSCFASQNSAQEIVFTNNGQGYATNVAIDIYKSSGGSYDEDLFSAIDETSVTYQIGVNGTPVSASLTAYATRNDGAYACLGSSPIGRIVVVLPIDIAPGQTIVIKWNSYHCCISECNNEAIMGWKYKVDYEDMCGNNNYSSTKTGESTTQLNMTIFTETPIDIDAGETLPFVYTISSHDNNLPVGTGANYEVVITLPVGLNWAGGANDLIWTSSPNNWTPSTVSFNASTRELTGVFIVPEPFNIQKSEIVANLTGDCSVATSGYKTISLDINYVPDTTCNSCSVEMICNKTTSTNLHCPLVSCEGFNFLSFNVERINYGNPDNDANGLTDNSGALDFSKIKINRVMVGDTLQTTYRVVVDTGASNSFFINFFVEADIDFGQNLSFLNGSIKIYDDVTSLYYTCTNFQTTTVDGANDARKFKYTFLPNFQCSGLPNTAPSNQFYFTHGDSIEFVVNYKVTGNIGANVEEVTINNDLFSSSLAEPWGDDAAQLSGDKWACDDYDGRFTLIGYYFSNSWASNYSVKSCTKTVQQNFWFSVGDCCDNYGGGNLFPYEYRNWAHVKEVRVSIPTDYEVVTIYFKQRRTKTTNSTSTQTVNNIVPYHNSGGNMYFDLEQHYKDFGGSLEYSDDGFHGTVYLELVPTCDVPINTYEDINWEFQFAQTDYLGGGNSSWYTSSPDRIRYNSTDLVLSSTNPIVDGLGRTVSWNLKVSNNTSNSSAANSWVHFKNPSGELDLLYLIDDSNGDTLQLTSDYFTIGTINTNSTKSYTVVGSYSACAPDYLVAYAGYECSGYPQDFAHFYCSYTTFALNVEPKNAEPQVTITGTTIGSECSNLIEVTIEVASVKFAHLDSVEVDITAIGSSMTFVSGSGQLKYPLTGLFTTIANPLTTLTGNTYQLMNINNSLNENGLPGVLDLTRNRFQLKLQMNIESNFKSGDYVQFSIKSKAICGTTLPVINLAYDPSVQFNENTIAGLSNDASDSWGIAWGDYDNDGFDDLYVAEYDVNSGSFLYHNNGDGSFTKETSGIVTTDGGSSIAGTWGDYNNDGHLDLFVANNTGAMNALYKNTGGGSFTKITTGDIANYSGYCHGASWVDYNNDGYLDLFVTDYMPTKFNLLYKNNGDETFTMVTNSALVQEAKHAIGATWADYDNDGDMDVFIPATNGESNSLYRNDGADVFTRMTTIGITADNANSVGCSWGDYDNDNDLDLFVTNTSNQDNFFYQNNGDGTFTQVTSGILVNDGGHSSSSNWVDFDNDGDMDLYICNDQSDKNTMYINNGDGTFSKPETPLSGNLGNSYSQAWSDFDNDGDLDVLVGNHSNETNVFFENSRANCNSWLCLKLTGVNSNRSAIGARISVKATIYGVAIWQLKEISAQTGGGAGSQNSLKALFGLGNATSVDSIIIQWPSGYRQELINQNINDCINVIEGDGVKVCGAIYNDINENCTQETGEDGIPGILVKTMPGNRYVTTDANGNYQFFLEPGDYTITQQISANWTNSCNTGGHDLTIIAGQTYCGNSFGNITTCTYPNLSITLGTTALRKGFQNTYSVVYANTGAYDAYSVNLSIEFHNDIIPLSATTAWSSYSENDTTTTYTWLIDTVKAMTYYDINILDSISVFSTIDKELTVSANITDNGNDCDNNNNSYVDVNPVVGAVDPNDLTVYPVGEGYEGYIGKKQELRYKIRFQNVGTYYAQNVTITNVLPDELDVNSIRDFLSDYEYTMNRNGQEITFTFTNIYLPDSSQNQKESNGFIEYKITPKSNIDNGTIISNQASIVFDFEEPLATIK
ncbi:MAG: VCBS repeat-containing protein [Flavobacteriales bacterium]|nr:VCBS repeat-containing protein [Flavobacteriales bacterium]